MIWALLLHPLLETRVQWNSLSAFNPLHMWHLAQGPRMVLLRVATVATPQFSSGRLTVSLRLSPSKASDSWWFQMVFKSTQGWKYNFFSRGFESASSVTNPLLLLHSPMAPCGRGVSASGDWASRQELKSVFLLLPELLTFQTESELRCRRLVFSEF